MKIAIQLDPDGRVNTTPPDEIGLIGSVPWSCLWRGGVVTRRWLGINGHAYTDADVAEAAGAELAQRSARKGT